MGLLLFLLGCSTFISADYSLAITRPLSAWEVIVIGNPQQRAKWETEPAIRVCAASEVPLSRVMQATRFWESLGYRFKGIRKDPFSTCMNPRAGEILITLPESGFANSHIASTRIYTHTDTDTIIKAKIFILPKYARKERVIEHEIGHALGWLHYPQRYHIMHPTWRRGGYERKGIRKQDE
jgi:hypothetical protein